MIYISLTRLIIVLIKAGYWCQQNIFVNRISLHNYYNLKLCLQTVLIRNMEIKTLYEKYQDIKAHLNCEKNITKPKRVTFLYGKGEYDFARLA